MHLNIFDRIQLTSERVEFVDSRFVELVSDCRDFFWVCIWDRPFWCLFQSLLTISWIFLPSSRLPRISSSYSFDEFLNHRLLRLWEVFWLMWVWLLMHRCRDNRCYRFDWIPLLSILFSIWWFMRFRSFYAWKPICW